MKTSEVWEIEAKFLIVDKDLDIFQKRLNDKFKREAIKPLPFKIDGAKPLAVSRYVNLLFDDEDRRLRSQRKILRLRWREWDCGIQDPWVLITRKQELWMSAIQKLLCNVNQDDMIMVRTEKETRHFVPSVDVILEGLNLLGYTQYFRYEYRPRGDWGASYCKDFGFGQPTNFDIAVCVREFPEIGFILEIETKTKNQKEVFFLKSEIALIAEELGLPVNDAVKKDVYQLYKDWCKEKGVEFKNQFVFEEKSG